MKKVTNPLTPEPTKELEFSPADREKDLELEQAEIDFEGGDKPCESDLFMCPTAHLEVDGPEDPTVECTICGRMQWRN